MSAAVTNPFAVIDELATKSASVGEMFATLYFQPTLSGTGSFPIFVAPFPLVVKQVSVVVWNSSVAADDTNYWRLVVRRMRANVAVEIASKTTQLTGGQAIAQRTDWNFDAVTFNATNALIAKGDIVDFAAFITGTATALNGPACTVRYEPV